MSIEQNKDIVRQFLAKFGTGDADGLIDSLTDDATWWIGGKPDDLPQAGPKTKDGISAVLRGIGAKIPGGIDMRIHGMIGEGDKVAAEVEARGEITNGRIYNNEYHFLFTIRDGRIAAVKEYHDTLHLKSVFAA
ncbi:MAG: nuclear transport factor 2 family protein [Alphaproteobacteria bacterium]